MIHKIPNPMQPISPATPPQKVKESHETPSSTEISFNPEDTLPVSCAPVKHVRCFVCRGGDPDCFYCQGSGLIAYSLRITMPITHQDDMALIRATLLELSQNMDELKQALYTLLNNK